MRATKILIKNVLTKAKEEINAVSNLWFDYIPARIAGEGRKGYQLLYLFIRYKTAEELEEIKENSVVSIYDDIIVEDRKNRNIKILLLLLKLAEA